MSAKHSYYFYKKSSKRCKGKAIIYAGITIGVTDIAGIMVFGSAAQQDRISPDAIAAPANSEDTIESTTGLGPHLNKEKWHEDPFADEAAESKAKSGLG